MAAAAAAAAGQRLRRQPHAHFAARLHPAARPASQPLPSGAHICGRGGSQHGARRPPEGTQPRRRSPGDPPLAGSASQPGGRMTQWRAGGRAEEEAAVTGDCCAQEKVAGPAGARPGGSGGSERPLRTNRPKRLQRRQAPGTRPLPSSPPLSAPCHHPLEFERVVPLPPELELRTRRRAPPRPRNDFLSPPPPSAPGGPLDRRSESLAPLGRQSRSLSPAPAYQGGFLARKEGWSRGGAAGPLLRQGVGWAGGARALASALFTWPRRRARPLKGSPSALGVRIGALRAREAPSHYPLEWRVSILEGGVPAPRGPTGAAP